MQDGVYASVPVQQDVLATLVEVGFAAMSDGVGIVQDGGVLSGDLNRTLVGDLIEFLLASLSVLSVARDDLVCTQDLCSAELIGAIVSQEGTGGAVVLAGRETLRRRSRCGGGCSSRIVPNQRVWMSCGGERRVRPLASRMKSPAFRQGPRGD
jgi:hypothetical protein